MTPALARFLSILPLLGGCATLRVQTRALPDVNDAQPVALHVHQLRKVPAGLSALGCAEVRPTAEEPSWAAEAAGEPVVVSALPGVRGEARVARQPGALWALVVPEWSTCADADGWALLNLFPTTRRVRLELSGRAIVLPWDQAPPADGGRRWHQRGYVDARPSHVLVRNPRVTR